MLKKKSNIFIYFVRKTDKTFFSFTTLFYFSLNKKNKFFNYLILWRTTNDHFLWQLRTTIIKILDLHSEFLKKFN